MPAHGGNAGLTDLELARGVAYMVNASGGKWTEPKSAKELGRAQRRAGGEGAVLKCHQEGKGGAPKIGDREAWSKRLNQGIDHAVHSAISGHGGMPPRDKADLTDGEVRAAILYMFNPKAPAKAKLRNKLLGRLCGVGRRQAFDDRVAVGQAHLVHHGARADHRGTRAAP